MPSKAEKRRRAKIVEAIAQRDTDQAIARMPISFTDLAALFDHLDEQLIEKGCDHTPRITVAFLRDKELEVASVIPWLEEFGGYCDCEVLANVEESWQSEIEKRVQAGS